MKFKEYINISKYGEIFHMTKLELAFCISYSILALIIAFYATPGGSLISPDSTAYIRDAENFLSSFPHYYQGPLYPAMISILIWIGLPSEQSAGLVPIIFYSLLGFPLFFIGKVICKPLVGYVTCIISLLCGKYVLYISTYAWTDMPYLFFSAIVILFMIIYIKYKILSSIELAGFFALIAFYIRPIGLTLIPLGMIVIITNNKGLKNILFAIAHFCLIPTAPIILWLITPNDFGTWLSIGRPRSTNLPLDLNVDLFFKFIKYIIYDDYKVTMQLIIILIVASLIYILLSRQLTTFFKNTIPISSYILIYSIAVILATSNTLISTNVAGFDFRYVIPIYPYIVLWVIILFISLHDNISNNFYKRSFKIISFVLLASIVAQGSNALHFKANEIRAQSLYEYQDILKLNEYISEYNITDNDVVYFDSDMGRIYSRLMLAFWNRTPKIKIAEIKSARLKTTILDNLTSHYAWEKSAPIRSILDLIMENKNHSIYLIAPRNLLKDYFMRPPKDICFINPIRLSKLFICKVNLKNNETCNANKFSGNYILEGNISTGLAGNYMGYKYDQLVILNKEENMFCILDLAKGSATKIKYENKPGATWFNANHTHLSGDFMSLGYDQELHIAGNRIIIEDFRQGTPPPAIIRDTTLGKLISAEEPLAGDFLNSGHSQVLFVERKGIEDRKIVIADFSKDKKPEIANFTEIAGNSTRMGLMLGEGYRRYSGDFMDLGYSQLMMINCNRTGHKEPKIIIIDFGEGKKSASVKYQENWGESTYLSGWLDANDTQLVGDFMGLGHSQMLFVNHGHAGGKITIADFSHGKIAGKYWEDWDQGRIFRGWLGINDTRIAGDFKELGYSQVLFLNKSINGSNATIVEFIDGMPNDCFMGYSHQEWSGREEED